MNITETCAARNAAIGEETTMVAQGCKARANQEELETLKAEYFAKGGQITQLGINEKAEFKHPFYFTSVTNKDRKGAQ